MTQPPDPVDELLDAYFDYLEGMGEEPSLDHLSDEQRAEAEQLIASLKAAEGIDPRRYELSYSVSGFKATASTCQEGNFPETTKLTTVS